MIKRDIIKGIKEAFDRIGEMSETAIKKKVRTRGADKDVNHLEDVVMQELSAFTRLDIVYEKEFGSAHAATKREVLDYAAMDEETTPAVLKFTHNVPNMIVHNPCGSQSWPDILVIKDNIGYPLEVKTAAKQQPKMNSGQFRLRTPYVVIKTAENKEERAFRFMFGEEMIDAQRIRDHRELVNQINKLSASMGRKYQRTCTDDLFEITDWWPDNYVVTTNSAFKLYEEQ